MRAKFKVTKVTKLEGGTEIATAMAVSADTPENQSFSKFTPSGNLEIHITNPDTYGFFEPGGSYYLDFTKA